MSVVVTGGAGFIGSHLVERISSDRSIRVDLVDSFDSFLYPSDLRVRWAQKIESERSNVHIHDVPMSETPIELLEKSDTIFNCGAIPGLAPSFTHPEKYWRANRDEFEALLQRLESSNFAGSLVHLSTSSVYGQRAVGSEELEPCPVSPYGESKLAAEELLRDYATRNFARTKVARLFSVYGPRQRDDMAYSIFIRKILAGETLTVYGDGQQSRSNTFVDDVVDAILGISAILDPGFEVFNVAGSERITLNHAISVFSSLIGKEPKLEFSERRQGDQLETHGDTKKLHSRTGWKPSTQFLSGASRQVEYILRVGQAS